MAAVALPPDQGKKETFIKPTRMTQSVTEKRHRDMDDESLDMYFVTMAPFDNITE